MANPNPMHLDNDEPFSASDDARIKSMLAEVPIPEGLNQRIKSRLSAAMLVDPCVQAHASSDLLVQPTDQSGDQSRDQSAGTNFVARLDDIEPVARGGGRTRRAVLALAMAAALAGFAFLANQWRQPNEREWLVKQCHTVLGNWEQDNPANLEIDATLAELPATVREQLARVTLRGTRSLTALGSKFKGTLYRVDAANGHSLVLMRLSELPAVRGLNSRFSILPTPSGGWSLVALQLNNETFVLAAECTEQELMNYIRRPVVT